nr:reverse transcriptase/maturase family protein [Chromobacterium sp. ASV5]
MLRQALADHDNLEAAYRWLCRQRRDYGHNDDVWGLRRAWAQLKPRLAADLLAGRYRLGPLMQRRGRDGSSCLLWSAQDALALRALAQVLGEAWAEQHSPHCYHVAGRGGLKGAVRALRRQLPGRAFVFRTDVKGYYANIDHGWLKLQLAERIDDDYLLALIGDYIACTVCDGGEFRTAARGITRGCPLAPLLGALHLDELDRAMAGLPVAYIRYMDDWVVLADSRWRLRRAIARVNQILDKLGLRQHPDKTFIGRVAAGFEFLGYHHTDKDITVAAKTLQRNREQITRLYEQGADNLRVGEYLRRWLRWCESGIEQLGECRALMDLRAWLEGRVRYPATAECMPPIQRPGIASIYVVHGSGATPGG